MSQTTVGQQDVNKTAVTDMASKKIDPIEGTSSENCSSTNQAQPGTIVLVPGEPVECRTCFTTANLSLFKQKQGPSQGKTEDIYRSYCSFCKMYFGICSKKVRGSFIFVSEEGKILSNAEKAEYFRAEKRKLSNSRSKSRDLEEVALPEVEADNTDTSATEVSVEKEEKLESVESAEPENSEEPEENGEPDNIVQDEVGVSQQKTSSTKKKRGRKNNWSSVKSKRRSGQSTTTPSSSSKQIVPRVKVLKKAISTPIDEKKRGRPVVKNTPKQCSVPTTAEDLRRSPMKKVERSTEVSDSSCQTDIEFLLKSVYLKDAFNQTMREGLGEQIAARLKDQPLMLRKQFLLMLNTIQGQENVIRQHEEMKEKYLEAVKKLKEFGRSTRLDFSDSFHGMRADLVERKEEFKAHEAEVASLLKSQRNKFEAYKVTMMQKYEDQKLAYSTLEAKIEYMEQEKTYERERAEYLLRMKDVYEKEKNKAVTRAETAVKNLNDRLYLADNEVCARCQAVERIRKKMTAEVAEMTEKSSKAISERNDAVERASLFESAAQKLGRDCDSIKYERDSWKAYAERYKKDVNRLTQSLKDKEKELVDKIAEIAATPKSISTPKSVACTPSYPERVSPPEDGEIIDTPPQGSPHPTFTPAKPVVKPLAQKIIEKKAPPPQIASGFESWIPKEKLHEPAPDIPKALSAFGLPIKPPVEKEKPKIAPSSQFAPWEKLATVATSSTSNSLTEALQKVQAESFIGGSNTSAPVSKSYKEEMNRMMKNRKRNGEEPKGEEKTKNPSAITTPAPPVKKIKPTTPAQTTPVAPKVATSVPTPTPSLSSTPAPTTISSLTNVKKIPKLSEKTPQAEFARALGLSSKEENNSTIPGLGMEKLDEETKEKEKEEMLLRKIKPAEPQKAPTPTAQPTQNTPKQQKAKIANPTPAQPQKQNNIISPPKKNNNVKMNNQSLPWHRPASSQNQPSWRQQPPIAQSSQAQYGIQSNQQRSFQMEMEFDRPWSDSAQSRMNDGGRPSNSFGSLPWHRAQDTPFGKVPIQDNFCMGGPPLSRPAFPPGTQQSSSFYSAPRDGFFNARRDFSPPRQPPPQQQRMYSPPPQFGYGGPSPQHQGRGNPRSFYG